MAVAELITALFNFDVAFILDFLLATIFWVFAFYAVGYFFSDKKKPLATGLVAAFIIISTIDVFSKLLQFTIYTAEFLMLLYIARLAVLLFLENSKYKQHIPLAYVLLFFIILGYAALGAS